MNYAKVSIKVRAWRADCYQENRAYRQVMGPEQLKIRTLVYVCPVDTAGTSLFVKGWMAPSPSKEPIPLIFVHDLGETIEHYTPSAERLAMEGFNVYCFEMRIQKKRLRDAGAISFEELASDLLQVVAWIKHKEDGNKPIVIGQGIGSLVALYFAQGHGNFASSLVLSSPLFSLQKTIRPLQRFLIRTLSQAMPTVHTPHWMAPYLTDTLDPDVSKKRVKVPLSITQELLIAISKSHKLFFRVSIPTLLLCPTEDSVCKYDILKRLISKHKNEERITMVTIDSHGHNLMTKSDQVLGKVLDVLIPWLKTHGRQS
ncbi:MAG: alpha/beta hydrolase [Deltaproteobacteria bacterium]|nr:alpha/beta hydrolase [Deltaproteobacteria bacterium]